MLVPLSVLFRGNRKGYPYMFTTIGFKKQNEVQKTIIAKFQTILNLLNSPMFKKRNYNPSNTSSNLSTKSGKTEEVTSSPCVNIFDGRNFPSLSKV